MEYRVVMHYKGTLERKVQADNPEEAIDAALLVNEADTAFGETLFSIIELDHIDTFTSH